MNPPVAEKIYHIEDPKFPQYHFEWHPTIQKVYIGVNPGKWEDDVFVPGDFGHLQMKILAEHCDTHARFYGFVQTYLRGYRQGRADLEVEQKREKRTVG